ncbi:MAG: hypothetical protein PHU03_06230 [Syntrophales bacterium]|nr:hypothetical protein [Syntrophales bacterium]
MKETLDRQGTRYELNRRVKQVLVRHGVNLTLLKWSSSKRTTSFYGILEKEHGEEFTTQGLDALIKELIHMPQGPRLRFSLENWDISSDSGSWKITKKKKIEAMDTWDERRGTVVIRKIEKTDDVLKEAAEKNRSDE